ncbi:MAG: hypothetical protein A2315_14215 [Ignavibacteria bacterium RIFOXYB2_FULL_35_12]|nr:MAG: hypothetical protein A2455_01540 [Ignavibacteria bacterium RIFOXYC2_FULL_35_16]OGV02244.1 MAG: hypothetical protein A2315_14215 [Ignavibacteria bacterium RIFOXYB2_FULL_35_12]
MKGLSMLEFVETVGSRFPELTCLMRKGERLRIMKEGWYGSLWSTYKKNTEKYHFELTGDVDTKLSGQISLMHGKYKLETRGYKYWDLNKADVEKIIKIYAHTT